MEGQINDNAGFIVGKYGEIRISKFTRYTRTYTVPTAPFPDY